MSDGAKCYVEKQKGLPKRIEWEDLIEKVAFE